MQERVSGIYDIENEFMIDAIIADCGQGEKVLAKVNIEKATKIIDIAKSIIIFDRGYPGIDLIQYRRIEVYTKRYFLKERD